MAEPAEARILTGAEIRADGEFVVHEALHTALAHWLASHNNTAGSSARIERLAVLAHPADLDSGEITYKGYVNHSPGGRAHWPKCLDVAAAVTAV